MNKFKFQRIAKTLEKRLFKPCYLRNPYANAFCYNRTCKTCYEKSLQSDKDVHLINKNNKIKHFIMVNGKKKCIDFNQPRFMLKKFKSRISYDKYLILEPKIINVNKIDQNINYKQLIYEFKQKENLKNAKKYYDNYEIVLLTNHTLFIPKANFSK